MPLSIGLVLNNRYRIDNLLGQGGMGAVYRAWDLNLKMDVAVKVNFAADPEAQRQFEREAGILARLSHPNLPRVTDYFFISDQGQFLVMDYVAGEDLQSMLDRLEVLPESQVLVWILEVCDALSYLHTQPSPIIHRDVKPANIRIRPDGRAMLVDFGIAKIYDPERSTTVGAQAVTPGYSPPEQYGGGLTDARSDIYALGATLYHLLTGEAPPESIHRMVRVATLVSPRHLNQSISPMVERSVIKAIEIETDRRFQSVDEFRDALSTRPTVVQRVSASDSMRAMEARSVPQERRSNRNLWFMLASGGSLVVIVLVISTLVLSQILRTTQSTPTAMIADLKTDTPLVADDPTATGDVSMTLTATPTGQAGAIHPTAQISEPMPTLAPTSTPHPEPTPTCPSVNGPFADEWYAIQDQVGCAMGDAVEGVIVEENFEGGKMFWREAFDQERSPVLFNDGTWRFYHHTRFVEGSPEFSCVDANTPAQCPPTPKRGFGMMWCNIPELRERLGNAVDCERGYYATMQTFDNGFILRNDLGAIYILYDDGTWQRR